MADIVPIRPLIEHAREYAAAGLEIFPVNPGNKTPLVSQYLATLELAQLDDWWAQWPNALIGHRIAPGTVLLDVDPRHRGDRTLELLAEAGANLDTRTHYSGRGDGGRHLWFTELGGKLSIRGLELWAREHGGGEAAGGTRWTSGIDLLRRDHRYTILPPSPHPDTGRPYEWAPGYGLERPAAILPPLAVQLLTPVAPTATMGPYTGRILELGDSIADTYSETARWHEILGRRGWTLVGGDGDSDGSQWRHPSATSPVSATVRHGCLFVYTPNTPFEETEPGAPHGYTRFAAYAILEHGGDQSQATRTLRPALHAGTQGPIRPDSDLFAEQPGAVVELEPAGPQPVDWPAFWAREHVGEDWLLAPILPRGRQIAIWATHKTGKSLITLEMAAALATGRGALTQPPADPTPVVYLDLEMTEDDLYERLEALGYGPETDLSNLHYYLLPSLPPLDTAEGGYVLHDIADDHRAQAVVLDTMARVVKGDENDADTYRNFYRHTGLGLKARGISVARLDHGGKDRAKGQRGSSSKGDDVDVVWEYRELDGGFELKRQVSRISWVPESVKIVRHTDPLRHAVTSGGLWPEGTKSAAIALRSAGITPASSQREAIAAGAALNMTKRVAVSAYKYLGELERRDPTDLIGGPE